MKTIGARMKKYKCLRTFHLGEVGDIISLSPNNQTNVRIKQGFIAELKVAEVKENKVLSRKGRR